MAAGGDDRHLRLRRLAPVRARRRRRAGQPGDGGRRRGLEPRPGTPARPGHRRVHAVGRPVVPGDRPQRLPAVDPPGHHLLPARGPRRVLPAVPDVVRAADRILPGGDTLAALACRRRWPSSPSSSSACSPAGCTTTTSPSGRWCCSPCSPARSCSSYAYAEALLIVLAAACLWFLLDERWLLAGVAAALATATDRTASPSSPPAPSPPSSPSAAAATGGRSSPRCWRRSASSPSSCSWPPTPARRGRGSASRREAWREGHQLRRHGDQQHAQLPHPPAGVADRRPHRGVARRPRPRAVVPVAQAAAVADGRLHRRRHRPDAAAGDGDGPPALPVHGVPAVHQRRRVVAAARSCDLGPHARRLRRRAHRV